MQIANKSEFRFLPGQVIAADAAAVSVTPVAMRPSLGPVANLAYKPASFAYHMALDAASGAGTVILRLKSAAGVLHEVTHALNGATVFTGKTGVNLSQISGEDEFFIEAEITVPGDAGRVITVDAILAVEMPLTLAGC